MGHIGKRHATMINENPGAELVAIVDIDEPLLNEAKETFKVNAYASIDEMLDNENGLDVVNICTPNGLHAEQAIKALKDKCHVVCEKPMGLSTASCEEVLHQALQASRQVFCVMQNRYSPPAEWLKEIMDQEVLGEIYMVQINCYWNRDDRYYDKSEWKGTLNMDGGPLYTQFSHFIDIMYWLFGDIGNIKAKFSNYNHKHNTEFEDTGFITFEFQSGSLGAFNYSTSVFDKNLESSMTIIGEKGTVKVGGQYMDQVEYCHIDGYEMPALKESNPPNDYGTYKGSAANHHYIIENVVQTLSGSSSITTNALEGMKVVDIIERIYALRKLPAETFAKSLS